MQNDKYLSTFGTKPIPEDEDISYEMSVNNKRYDAGFYFSPMYNNKELDSEVEKNAYEVFTPEQREYLGDDAIKINYLQEHHPSLLNGIVWFMISKEYNDYYILLYYDNLDNRPHGEDL